MPNRSERIKTIYKLIDKIKEEIKLPEEFQERKMYHAWIEEPLCNVVNTTWHHEIDIKIKDIEERLNNNSNKTILKGIEKELLKIMTKINQKNGWDMEESKDYQEINFINETNKLSLTTHHKTKISNKFVA